MAQLGITPIFTHLSTLCWCDCWESVGSEQQHQKQTAAVYSPFLSPGLTGPDNRTFILMFLFPRRLLPSSVPCSIAASFHSVELLICLTGFDRKLFHVFFHLTLVFLGVTTKKGIQKWCSTSAYIATVVLREFTQHEVRWWCDVCFEQRQCEHVLIVCLLNLAWLLFTCLELWSVTSKENCTFYGANLLLCGSGTTLFDAFFYLIIFPPKKDIC